MIESDVSEKINLIFRNLKESTGQDVIKGCLEKNKTVSVYWGTAPTGRPHIAYFLPMTKIGDFLNAGCHVTILFADLHAFLDNMKAPWELLQKRTEYYEILIKGMLKALNVPLEKLRFIRGTDYQLQENYTKAVYQIIGLTSVRDASKAGCEVVKQVSDPLLSGIVYPLLQCLDEEFLGVDVQFGGVDQRKIFMYAEKYNPSLSYSKRAHLMNPMLPGLEGGKMSASEADSKIDLLDTRENVERKLSRAKFEGKTAEENAFLALLKCVALPKKSQFDNAILNAYNQSEDIEKDFADGKLTETDLKNTLEIVLLTLMKDLRKEFTLENKDNLVEEAYPSVVVETQKEEVDRYTLPMTNFHVELEALREEFHEVSESFPHVMARPTIMWSCRSSGEPHIGYLIPLRKLASLSTKNWKVIILIEDIAAYLHSKHLPNKPTWDLLPERAHLYTELFRHVFEVFGGRMDNLEIVLGSEFQLSSNYAMLMYQSLSKVTENECHEMADKLTVDRADVTSNLSAVMYPCISVLDQLHLRPTVRMFGTRQCAVDAALFDRNLSNRLGLGHRMPVYVHHDNLVTLEGKAVMGCPKIVAKTAPKDLTSISMCDNLDVINQKMKRAFFDPKSLTCDPSLNIIDLIIWPQLNGDPFTVKRTPENGGDVDFKSLSDIKDQLIGDLMHPGDIKTAASNHLFDLIVGPIQRRMSKDCSSLLMAAYPEVAKTKKINKKAYSPNNIDLRVAVVDTIIYVSGSYYISIKMGLDRFTMTKKSLCHLSPNDHCLVAIKPSSADQDQQVIGVVTRANDGGAVKLAKRPYSVVVSFKNHDVVGPHMKESDVAVIVKMVGENVVIRKDYLEWVKDGSRANEVNTAEISGDSVINVAVDIS